MRADFASQAYFRDPTTEIEKLRSAGPVVEVHFPMIGKVWTTTTQELADQVLKDGETFSIRTGVGSVTGQRWWMPRIVRTLANQMLAMDDPDHKRLRGIVDEAFRRRAVLDMEPHILALADELAADLFAQGNPADLVDRYARKLPLSVICELLGLPAALPALPARWASSASSPIFFRCGAIWKSNLKRSEETAVTASLPSWCGSKGKTTGSRTTR
jgi:cytochrome P450